MSSTSDIQLAAAALFSGSDTSWRGGFLFVQHFLFCNAFPARYLGALSFFALPRCEWLDLDLGQYSFLSLLRLAAIVGQHGEEMRMFSRGRV